MMYTPEFWKQLPQLPFDVYEGQRLKREGLAQVAKKNREFLCRLRDWAKGYSLRYGSVTIDEVRRHADMSGLAPTHHNCYGAVFHGTGWTVVGRQPSKLAANRGREIKVWRWEGV